ncbi:MAG: serine phosphatase RsbU (regulator of sigma subunit) [Candidatus Paceibacteria bacterium]|jgi:serine phosphatase RsbU (regulator of sigma subunit)
MVFWKRKKKVASESPADVPQSAVGADRGQRDPFMTGNVQEDRRRSASLFEEFQSITERVVRLGGKEDLDDLLTYIVDASIRRTGSERGMLILDDGPGSEGAEKYSVRVARGRGGETLAGVPRFSTSVVARVLESGEGVKDISGADAGNLGASIYDLKLRALMCVPLEAGQGQTAFRGVLYVDSKAATREFDHADLAYFSTLSNQIVGALKSMAAHLDAVERARLEASLDYASVVQNNLMPQIPSDFVGFDVFGWFRAAERTSGDFYDFFKTRDGRYAVVVGDVTGHGPASALITSQAQASLRSMVRIVPDLGEAVTLVNQDISDRIELGNFVTLFVALFSEDGSVEVVNAGHTPPRVFESATGTIRTISAHGPALGMLEDFTYDECDRFNVNLGDVLLAFTDGITEARKLSTPDDLLGEEGLETMFKQELLTNPSARTLTENLVASVVEFCDDNCEDDMTMVCVRRTV